MVEFRVLRQAIFVTFWNQKSDKRAHFTQWLARCVEVRKMCRSGTFSSTHLLFFTPLLTQLCVWSATQWMSSNKDKCALLRLAPLYDGRLFRLSFACGQSDQVALLPSDIDGRHFARTSLIKANAGLKMEMDESLWCSQQWTDKCLDNPQTSIWTLFIGTTFYWRRIPYENGRQCVLWIMQGNRDTVSGKRC